MFGPDVTEDTNQEQFYQETSGYPPPNEDQGEQQPDSTYADTYEERVDDAITGVMDEEEGATTS